MKHWSIIIPTLNEQENLARCLESLRALAFPHDGFEVLVVDNGSADATIAIANSYAETLNLRVLSVPKVPVGAVRNSGARIAEGGLFAFLDADCIVEIPWLQSATEVLNEHPAAIVGAHYAMPSDAGWAARLWHRRFCAGRCGDVPYIPGGNLVMTSSTFWTVGGFDPTLRSNEDSEFCSRARRIGIRVLAFPQLAAIHLGAEKNLLHFVKRQLWHGANVISRSGLRGNIRAIGLAFYTLACLIGILLAAGLGRLPAMLAMLIAMLVPPFVMALRGTRAPRCGKDLPSLVLLLLTYALVRACVLPVALLRGARRWNLEGRG